MTATVMVGHCEHWLNSDGIRTYVGPVRHAATRRVLRARGRGRSILDKLFGRGKEEATTQIIDIGEAQTEVLHLEAPAEQEQSETPVPRPQTLEDMMNGARKAFGLPPFKPPTRWQRVRDWFTDRFYDEEWHRGMRNTAGTLLMWSFTVAASVCFGKGMLWILSL
jgi:hypothetical protein